MKRGLNVRPHISYRRFLVRRRRFGAGPRYIKVLPGAGLLRVPLSVPQPVRDGLVRGGQRPCTEWGAWRSAAACVSGVIATDLSCVSKKAPPRSGSGRNIFA